MKACKYLAILALIACSAARAQTVPTCPTSFYVMGHMQTLWLPCFYLHNKPGAPISLPAAAAPAWGTSPAQVQALFPYNMLLNFAENPNLDAMVSGMDNLMIARLSTELAAHDVAGYSYSVMAYAGERLSAANLHRIAAAFGPGLFSTAVAYMPAATLAAYNASAATPPLFLSAYWSALNPAAAAASPATGDLWLYDLLLDEYTAGAGGSTTAALGAVSRYVNAKINNVILVAISLGSAFLGLYNSPQMQLVLDNLATFIVANGRYINNLPAYPPSSGMIITINPALQPPPVDPGPVPELPPIEGDAALVCFVIFSNEGC
jgi:hypothetical protein